MKPDSSCRYQEHRELVLAKMLKAFKQARFPKSPFLHNKPRLETDKEYQRFKGGEQR